MKIFDAHCHLSKDKTYPLTTIGRNIIFNDIDEYKNSAEHLVKGDVTSLIFEYRKEKELLNDVIQNKKIIALKIHNRIQKLNDTNTSELINALSELNTGLPVIYDAFYYGTDLNYQPSLKQLIALAEKFPQTNFIVAHCGGHHALDYLFHLRGLKNIYMDVSFSLTYLHGSSAYLDLVHLLKHTATNKILFGTDFPKADASAQLKIFESVAETLKWTTADLDKICSENAKEVFNL